VAGGREHDPSVGGANILAPPTISRGTVMVDLSSSSFSLMNISEPKMVAILYDEKHRLADSRDE
jgi:hypothetical protein